MQLRNLKLAPTTLVAGISAIVAAGASGSACTATKPTELVPGALSQIAVPHDLAGIKLQVFANGNRKFSAHYGVTNGIALLPGTLGVVSGGSAETTVEVVLAGYNSAGVQQNEFPDDTQSISQVDPSNPKGPGPRVRRGSVQTYVNQHTLFLPMTLSYSCWGSDCSSGGTDTSQVCKANSCVSNATDSSKLVDFNPSLIDGTQDCFSPSQCFPALTTTTAVLLDSTSCLYEVPPDQTVGLGLNVRILYQDLQLEPDQATPGTLIPVEYPTTEQEIINEEPTSALVEGFSIPDPGKPLQFQLASGLCKLVQAATQPPAMGVKDEVYHTIGAVQVSTACPSKVLLAPVCAAEQNPPTSSADGGTNTDVVCNQPITLEPAPSAIYMVMDNSEIMSGAFGPQGYATAMGLSLSNPLFKRTYVAFDFLDHNKSDCFASSTPYTSLADAGVDFALASVAQPSIAGLIGVAPQPEGPVADGGQPAAGYLPLELQTALRSDQGAFRHLSDFATALQSKGDELNVGAAIFFVNRQPDSTGATFTFLDGGAACSAPGSGAAQTPPYGQDCNPALDTDAGAQNALVQEIIAADKLGLQSYFVVLANGLCGVGDPKQWFLDVQTAVKAAGVTTMQVIDATEPKAQAATVLSNFSNVAASFGTCLYELPPGVGVNATLQFTLPIPTPISHGRAPAPVTVAYNSKCSSTTRTTESGWNIEGNQGAGDQHIRICGNDCSELRQSVQVVAAVTLSGGGGDGGAGASDAGASTIPEVPVTVTMPCTDAGM